jgi:enoyl-CoA hydratase/carnithine racemase
MDDLSNPMENYTARHFLFAVDGGVATLTLNRPERKNPLTFDACAELRDLFRALAAATDVKAVVLTGAGANFCSGGDVHDIIGPLTTMPALLDFTRLTGAVVQAMRACPQPVIAAIDGGCAGAGAMLALGSDLRYATARSQGRAAELLYTGRSMDGVEAERWGFVNRLCAPEAVLRDAQAMGAILAAGHHVRARHDQENAAPGVGLGRGCRHRSGRTGAGTVHGHCRLPARVSSVCGADRAALRRQLAWRRHAWPTWSICAGRFSTATMARRR